MKTISKSINIQQSAISPVVFKTVQGCNQIDLVDMRSMSVTQIDVKYNYVISFLDVF